MEHMMFRSFDNTLLYVEKHFINNSGKVVILIHGLSEYTGRYQHVAKRLNEEGYNVIALDNRGNGRSGGKKGDVKSFHDFLDDTHEIVLYAKELGFKKVYLLGHSLGGFIVNAYGVKYNDVDGIISSGAVGIFLPQVKLFKVIPFKLLKFINIKNGLDIYLSHDPKVREDYINDVFVNKKNKVNLFGECFIKGVKYIHKNIKNLTVPILYLHGTDDKIVPSSSSLYLYENVASKDKELKLYEKYYHEIFNEVGKEQVFRDVVWWLKRHE